MQNLRRLAAVVFSVRPEVQTKVYPFLCSPIAGDNVLASCPQPASSAPPYMTDPHHLLQQCRELLYQEYHCRMGWRPDPSAHTKFEIREKMFCDRYDETAMWISIIDPSCSKVVACARLLSAKLAHDEQPVNEEVPDLDMLGYSGCPDSFRDWVRAKGTGRVIEFQRLANATDYQRFYLTYHVMHVSAFTHMCGSSSPFDPKKYFFFSSPLPKKYLMVNSGAYNQHQNWTICYDEADAMKPIPIYTLPVASVTPNIEAFFGSKGSKETFLQDRQKPERCFDTFDEGGPREGSKSRLQQ